MRGYSPAGAPYNPGVRRLPRILLSVATVLSLVLCGATVAMWVRSYSVSDEIRWTDGNGGLAVGANAGWWLIYRGSGPKDPSQAHTLGWQRYVGPPSDFYATGNYLAPAGRERSGAGMRLLSLVRGGFRLHAFLVHLAYPTGLFALPPIAWVVAHGRRCRRARPGLCPACGYDLRATPDRCPECGPAFDVPSS